MNPLIEKSTNVASFEGSALVCWWNDKSSQHNWTAQRYKYITLNVKSLYIWAIQLMRAYASSLYNTLFILLIRVGYLGIDISPTSLPQWSTLLSLLMSIMYKHVTPNTIYYYFHSFSLILYTCSVMYTAWSLTLYHNPIYCWALSLYNYFNVPYPTKFKAFLD